MKPAPWIWAVVVAGLLASCTPAEAPTAPETSSAEVILEAREVLGDPMLQLAERALAVSEGIDAARHRLPRGEEMLRGVNDLAAQLDELRTAIADAQEAASEAPVEEAAVIVEEAAATADAAATAARAEIAFLKQIGAIDTALLAAAAEWDRPGSQTEIRERLDALAGEVDRMRGRAKKLRPTPRACAVMPRNRRRWVATVHSRTIELQGQANSAGGSEYDRLRTSYRALPLAEEPRVADRADRDCWLERSPVAKAAPAMRTAVEDLRKSLSG